MSGFRPMLAAEAKDLTAVQFPVLASPKLDGIRCVIHCGKALTRSLKPIPNDYIRNMLEDGYLPNLDGEILIRSNPGRQLEDWAQTPFNEVSSAVMSRDGEPDFLFAVFDQVQTFVPFEERLEGVHSYLLNRTDLPFVTAVNHGLITSMDSLTEYNEDVLGKGYEGVILRKPSAMYKFGRSTLKEGGMLKLKPFADGEAEIVGYVEKLTNTNEATTNALGLTERSHKSAGMVGANTLGTLIVRGRGGRWDGVQFEIGTGFTDTMKKAIWTNRAYYHGALVKFKYQEIGSINRPRIPVFLGFRHEADM